MKLKSPQAEPKSKGFTVVELLVVVAVLSLLSALMLPVFAKARQSPQATQCMNNHRQVMLAALMYADDNAGLWFPNQPGAQRSWVTSSMDFVPSNTDNTNLTVFTNSTRCFSARYIKSPTIFHCPADLSRVSGEGLRVRSVAASQAVGTLLAPVCNHLAGDPVTGQWLTGVNTDCDNTFRRYGRISDMVAPTPAALWVFIDQHCGSINDAGFAMECAVTTLGGASWVDTPASYHNGATTLSYADGHVEIHKWIGSLPTIPNDWTGVGNITPHVSTVADVSDVNYLQVRTSAKF